ncbi:hypothetical protein HELRODRAFT_175499 [Helobdella robusta]|uniref:Uncharacterized protein n=1 Tax=Helobdella robusta TaxID=6412 RepID=T1F9C0_HELRO|nr:hypothetical protein HELRODRAFT_175499 [Helobdella robusta]ESO00540.1 hypothetical protein HELRODRAFT_175499 [Helobdella robusta]
MVFYPVPWLSVNLCARRENEGGLSTIVPLTILYRLVKNDERWAVVGVSMFQMCFSVSGRIHSIDACQMMVGAMEVNDKIHQRRKQVRLGSSLTTLQQHDQVPYP